MKQIKQIEQQIENQIRGKKARTRGGQFEKDVRKNLEEDGILIVFKNPNNILNGKYTNSPFKFNPITKRPMMLSSGFPDYLCYNPLTNKWFFIECKVKGYLSKEEKEKIVWLKSQFKHSKFFIAHKKKGKLEIEEI